MAKPKSQQSRRGFSLLEMMLATTLSAALVTSTVVVLRSSYAVWTLHQGDAEQAEQASAVLRHLTRACRQADMVVSISASGDPAGSLEVLTKSGDTIGWELDSDTVNYSSQAAGTTSPLAFGIDTLTFEGLLADGSTTADDPSEVQAIRCSVGTTIPSSGATRTIGSTLWMRSW
ncbi:hypothetical protein Mal64_03020 [Pseudobythopirellula maris]|uniref:Prepilin-type N-terminal cleavage/methylation domain-containing protein n=1 Tax=Pseudobythopirellula maris TaxID=2527991 RepID=A0A5C5ZRJ7_9BACT|nr:prepilin-type N-terminal cleavage/methylation domain-containing protein [Pseudobythopirellula maris]TWT89920.1 hypothetical protein Mal64_03020 [Pseudobythopirellula maris]